MKIEITLDLSPMRWLAGIAIVAICASCVPRTTGQLSSSAFAAATAPAPARLDTAAREQVSRKVARLLVPVSTTPAAAFIDSSYSEEDRQRSLDCLTAALYYEARSESEDGQRAVAQVVLNRVRHPAFPSTVCGVVFQGSNRTTGCQFSFTCDGSMRGRRQAAAWIRAHRLAAEALAGSVFAPVGNATHYHTTAILPYWASHLRKSAIVGAHIFYRWAGNAGEASAFRQKHGGLEPAPALWQASGKHQENGVTIHIGSTPQKWREEIALDEGETVTVHRGAAPQRAAQEESGLGVKVHRREAAQEKSGFGVKVHRREAAQDASASGVRVHRGTPPAIG